MTKRLSLQPEPIGVKQVLDGKITQIDHILPTPVHLMIFHKQSLCFTLSNQEKKNIPYETWGSNKERWSSITANLKI